MVRNAQVLGPGVALAVALGACSGTQQNFDGGVYPVDASICNCASQGDPCGTQWTCCPNLVCNNGTCVAPGQVCAVLGERCSASTPCCVPPPPDGGYPPGSVPPITGCRPNDAGFSTCFIGVQPGDPCGPGQWGCTNALVCNAGGSCQFAQTPDTCPHTDGGPCVVGDNCKVALFAGNDDCAPWGLDCLAGAGTSFVCQVPAVFHPPNFPLAGGLSANYSVCSPGRNNCEPYPGDPAPVACGSFYVASVGAPVNVCVESCTTGDDCGSLAWDCINGQCQQNYCYAAKDAAGNDVATELTAIQGTPVSNDPLATLYKPCAHGGPNTVCLPTYDSLWNTTTASCYRVGGPDAGGLGASCKVAGAREQLSQLCAAGTMCLKGTCLQWCDVSRLGTPCPSTQSCVAVGGALITSSATPFGVGVCTETCDPTQNAANDSCPQISCGQPFKVCKPSGIDNDVFPAPGNCVGGVNQQVPVGQACDPTLERDPCVSGALCVNNGQGSGFLCAQVCNPSPSPGVTAQPCPGGTACVGLGPPYCFNQTNRANGYACHHLGVCR
jgi:hypothetical protein